MATETGHRKLGWALQSSAGILRGEMWSPTGFFMLKLLLFIKKNKTSEMHTQKLDTLQKIFYSF